MVAQVTGADPGVGGVYYDDEYNHDLLPAGTTNCSTHTALGAAVNFDESLDKNYGNGGSTLTIDAGEGLAGLPGSILQMTSTPQTLLAPSALPVDPKTCKPVYPNQYLKVNTVFNVRARRGPADRVVRQAPGVHDPRRSRGQRHRRHVHPRDQQQRSAQRQASPGGIDWTGENAATRSTTVTRCRP